MQYFENTRNFKLDNSCVTLGKFDGIHAGHRELLKKLKEAGEKNKVVFSFYMHPATILSSKNTQLIYTVEEKKLILEKLGMDYFISYPFDEETKNMTAEAFLSEVLVGQLNAKKIVVGEDFRFGNGRNGDVNLLRKKAKEYGFEVIVMEKLQMDEKIVSSSTIREELSKGNITTVNRLLEEPYFIGGIVKEGKKLGRTIDMPTINIYPDENKLLPPYGVYASEVEVDGTVYSAVTNVGVCPTTDKNAKPSVETYLFDFSGDLYGKYLRVQFHKFLRPEQKFDSVEALRKQMELDKENARNL